MNGYRLSGEAVRDLHDIWMYIAQDDIAAADRLNDRFTKCFEMLARQPLIGEPRAEIREGLRSFPVGNYVVFHSPMQDRVLIHRVLHGARDVEAIMRDGP